MNTIKNIYNKIIREPLMVKPVVRYNFIEGEKVIFNDGYNKYEVVIQGIWQDMATIVYDDGFKCNIHITNISKI